MRQALAERAPTAAMPPAAEIAAVLEGLEKNSSLPCCALFPVAILVPAGDDMDEIKMNVTFAVSNDNDTGGMVFGTVVVIKLEAESIKD